MDTNDPSPFAGLTARIEFTNHKTGKTHVVMVEWNALVQARSASAEAWNASNRLCEDVLDAHALGRAAEELRAYRTHHDALRKVLGLADEDWRIIMKED